jgi:hypothetical protein
MHARHSDACEAFPPDGPGCMQGPRSDGPTRAHCQSHTLPRSKTGHSAARCSVEGACRHGESGWCRRGWPRVWPLACAWPVTWPVEARGRGRQRAPDEGCNHQHQHTIISMQPRACNRTHLIHRSLARKASPVIEQLVESMSAARPPARVAREQCGSEVGSGIDARRLWRALWGMACHSGRAEPEACKERVAAEDGNGARVALA